MYNLAINEPKENEKYTKRVATYGLIKNAKDQIAIIRTSTGFFLPGGGAEDDEKFENCVRRECIEEVGMQVKVGQKLGVCSFYFYSTKMNYYMLSEGHFYECFYKKMLDVENEHDHSLIWLDHEDAVKKLYLRNQKFAVEEYFK